MPPVEQSKGPLGQRRGRGARERILAASRRLFRDQGIAHTGMEQLCAEAQVSKRSVYQHFGGKDDLVVGHLAELDPDVMPEVFDAPGLTARQRLLKVFDVPPTTERGVTPLCPFVGAAVEIADPRHPARECVRQYKRAVAGRLTTAAREAGAADPELLGDQLALLLDGATARTRALDAETLPVAAAIAAQLVDQAVPVTGPDAATPGGAVS